MRKCVIISVIAGLLSACADALPVTDVATVTNYLAQTYSEQRGTSNANVRVLTVDEAVASVDKVFAKAPSGNFSSDRLARMKRLLKENLAFVYSHDATVVGKPLEYRCNGKRMELPVDTSFSVYAYRERLFDSDIEPIYSFSRTASIGPRLCSGWVAWVSKADGAVFNLQYACNRENGILPFPVRRLETAVSTGVLEKVEGIGPAGEKRWRMERRCRDDCEVQLIADVEEVSFNSFERLNHTHVVGDSHGYTPATPVATYRVELVVRKVEEGSIDFDRVAFVVDPRQHENFLYDYGSGWPFFRGLTVRVRLCREGGALRIACVNLALPYPPRSIALCLQEGSVYSRFALNPQAVERPRNAVATEYVQYGDHTLAKFYSTTNDITGSFGRFPDYSRTVRVEVWTASEGADADYWRTAWFAERQSDGIGSRRSPIVTVRNVEEGMDAETRIAFAWYDFMLSPRELSSVKTLGAFADLVNRHTVCKTCGKPHYRIVLPDDLRPRVVSFGEDALGRVLDLLKSVCERTGCVYALKGTDLVLASELSDAELSDTSLKGRLNILEKDGFASVVGADYAGLYFFEAERARENCERPHFHPHVFAYNSAYVTTGNGWRRKDADGKMTYLAFDAVWWPGKGGRGSGFSLREERPRIARDVAKVRAYLRDAAESPDDFEFSYDAVAKDSFALAFALHLHQFGRTEDAQSIYDALCLRPAAAESAFAKLRQRVKLGKLRKGGK